MIWSLDGWLLRLLLRLLLLPVDVVSLFSAMVLTSVPPLWTFGANADVGGGGDSDDGRGGKPTKAGSWLLLLAARVFMDIQTSCVLCNKNRRMTKTAKTARPSRILLEMGCCHVKNLLLVSNETLAAGISRWATEIPGIVAMFIGDSAPAGWSRTTQRWGNPEKEGGQLGWSIGVGRFGGPARRKSTSHCFVTVSLNDPCSAGDDWTH